MSSPPARSLLSTGYIALDVVRHGATWSRDAGGTASNVASALSYLGWSSAVLGSIGDDYAGHTVAAELRGAGVDTRDLSHDASGTPVVVQHVTPRGPRYEFRCPACGRRSPRYRPISRGAAAEYLATTTTLPDILFLDRVSAGAIDLAKAFKAADRFVLFEPSTLGRPQLFAQAASLADLVKFADDRMKAFADALPRRRRRQIRVVTMGAKGCRIHFEGAPARQPAVEVSAIDSAGAGDWTTAGLLHSLPTLAVAELGRGHLEDSIRFAQALAALSCRFVGARGLARNLPAETTVKLCHAFSEDTPPHTEETPPAMENALSAPTCRSPESCALA